MKVNGRQLQSAAKCCECGWKYPMNILSSMHLGNGFITPPMCGICALELSNEFNGIKREKFDGTSAEVMRQAAIMWRERHPNDCP